MGQLRNEVWGSIDTVLVIKGIIEHCADQFLFLRRFFRRKIDALHIRQSPNILHQQRMHITRAFVQLINLCPHIIPLFGQITVPAVIRLEAHLLGDPFPLKTLHIGFQPF
ncbi:MAG: hypothetical protein BGO55_30890 [Sphingobacteriales bacterium 50-39]|nr:MAG: hypothetical protein BGO55_30890 [Sphingobacteriales bacterium 50-39]